MVDKNKDIINEEAPDDELELEEIEEGVSDKIKTLKKKLADCVDEKRALCEDLQRARADFLNSRKRLDEQLERDRNRAKDDILSDLIALADSFETAMSDPHSWESVDPQWRAGMEAIHVKLQNIFESNAVTVMNPVGEKFDPTRHEAVSSETIDDPVEVDTIRAVLQKGYERNNTVLRAAKVVVGSL